MTNKKAFRNERAHFFISEKQLFGKSCLTWEGSALFSEQSRAKIATIQYFHQKTNILKISWKTMKKSKKKEIFKIWNKMSKFQFLKPKLNFTQNFHSFQKCKKTEIWLNALKLFEKTNKTSEIKKSWKKVFIKLEIKFRRTGFKIAKKCPSNYALKPQIGEFSKCCKFSGLKREFKINRKSRKKNRKWCTQLNWVLWIQILE